MHAAFADGHGPFEGTALPRELFERQLEAAVADGIQLIIHTGGPPPPPPPPPRRLAVSELTGTCVQTS